ncbi:MAG TPA: hypothetical protein PKW76_16180 [bacterium]|nr:hypothetical protein [bacterium]
MSDDIYYRRHLPHYQPPEATYFVTFRLAGSLPNQVVAALKTKRQQAEKDLVKLPKQEQAEQIQLIRYRYFGKFDRLLDCCGTGPQWLAHPEIRRIVHEAIRYRDDRVYHLLAFTIMPNHMHLVFELLSDDIQKRRDSSPYRVTSILENLKWYTALHCNRILGRKGQFWQYESYDHMVRNFEELGRIVQYILENPVKAGLAKDWREWPGNYVIPGFLQQV